MQNETMKRITSGLKQAEISSKTFTSDPDELCDILFTLYPTEIVRAAQEELGQKAMSDYFVEIYEFAETAQTHQAKIKKSQLNGVVLTHNKITKWLAKKNINDVFELADPTMLKIYLQHHLANMKKSMQVFEDIYKAIT